MHRLSRRGLITAGGLALLAPAAPALAALLGLNPSLQIGIPGSSPSNPTTTIKVSVPEILGTTDLTGGLTQTTTALTQLLSGLKNAASVAAPVVQAHATEAAANAIG